MHTRDLFFLKGLILIKARLSDQHLTHSKVFFEQITAQRFVARLICSLWLMSFDEYSYAEDGH